MMTAREYQKTAFAPYYERLGQEQALLSLNTAVGGINAAYGVCRMRMTPHRIPRTCAEMCKPGEPRMAVPEEDFRNVLREDLRLVLRNVAVLAAHHGIGLGDLMEEDWDFMIEEGKKRDDRR